MSALFSNTSMEDAEAAIKSEQSYQTSKGEKALNAIGSKVLAVSGSEEVSLAQKAMASAEFSLLKDQVSNFAENTKILVSVLDDLGKLHPFIQAAVVIFKAGIQLELTRRENDHKVIALNVTMCDMMSVLKILKKVGGPKQEASGGISIEERLGARMNKVIDSIKSCAKLCDSYQRRNTAIKFFTSSKWQSKFTGVAEQFVTHQNSIQAELQMYVSVEITNTNVMLSDLNKNVNTMMAMVFEHMQSPQEREIAKIAKNANFVQSKDGETTAPDDRLLKEVIKSQESSQKTDDGNSGRESSSLDLATLKREMNKDVDTVLAENGKVFDRTFEATEIRLKEVKGTIVRESDRVIESILAGVSKGPQDRILDKDIHHIWQDMGWRGSVNAPFFVMAIQDHFSSKSNAALNEIQVIANESSPASPTQNLKDIASITQHAIPATPAEDLWALQYITVARAQPLMEALDEDGSSIITVNEVNVFTTSRPEGWSVPRWIAYWTYGFEMTTQWYYRRIRRLFYLLSQSSKTVLPANRWITTHFMGRPYIRHTEDLLVGLQDVDSWDGTDWANDHIFLKFKSWVLENENKMEEILRILVYYIDQDNTLNTVTGGGRPERYMMPLFYLLLRRCLWVMERAHDVVLDTDELNKLDESITIVHFAVKERVRRLKAIYKLQNVQEEDKLRNIFFGLYTYTFGFPKRRDYWPLKHGWYDDIEDEPPTSMNVPEPELYYKPPPDELDLYTDSKNESVPNPPDVNNGQEQLLRTSQVPQLLVGVWSGMDSYWSGRCSDGLNRFTISQHTPGGQLKCSGVNAFGPFSLLGRITGNRIIFVKQFSGVRESARYEGVLNEARDEISGIWGAPLGDEEETALISGGDRQAKSPKSKMGNLAETKNQDAKKGDAITRMINIGLATPKVGLNEPNAVGDGVPDGGPALESASADTKEGWGEGTFILTRRPADYALCRPSEEEFQKSKPRALWSLVRNVARYWFRTRHLTWEGIKERQEKRRMYLHLWGKMSGDLTLDDPADALKWAELVRFTHPDDLHLWHSLARFESRRDPIHRAISCSNCGNEQLESTRIVCIECSPEDDSFDLCANCQGQRVYPLNHKPSHTLIQFRWCPLMINLRPLISQAKDWLENISDEDVKHCARCTSEVSERPYWYCAECKEDTFICIQCNDLSEKGKPWLRQQALEPSHDHFHTMLLHPEIAESVSDKPELTTDERLAKLEEKLEARLDKLEEMMQARLSKQDEMIERVILAITRAE